MHALVIEDMPLTAWMIEEELRELGYSSVATAATEEEAIAAAKAQQPDLITSDGKLEEGSGIAAVLSICAGKSLPVIFITGYRDLATHALPDAIVLEKPISHLQLADAVRRARLAVRQQ